MISKDCTISTVAAAGRAHLRVVSSTESTALIDGVSALVDDLFAGRHPDYQQADLKYHTLEHTVFATQCYVDLAAGRVRHGSAPVFNARQFSLGFAAIAMHDSGYLKTRDDLTGTGAKYTSSHVARSCAMAAAALPALGCDAIEIEGVQNAIRCTGLNSRIEQITFRNEIERLTGCMIATADYLGQMADPDYPSKLPALFAEFEEANDFNGVPADKRPFRSARDLMAKTSGFWHHFARPKLENEYSAVYRLLAESDGRNPYLESVESNLVRIAALAQG